MSEIDGLPVVLLYYRVQKNIANIGISVSRQVLPLENTSIQNPGRLLEVTLGSSADRNLCHDHSNRIFLLKYLASDSTRVVTNF